MTREKSPPGSRWAMFAFSFVFAVGAAVLGGGTASKSANAAEGDGSFVLCKQYWATGPSINNFDAVFGFDIAFDIVDGPDPAPLAVEIETIESGEDCTDPITIPAGAEVTVTETLPAGWVNTPTYPRSVLSIGGAEGPLVTGSTVASFDGARCVATNCVLTFKNKQDEAGEGVVPPLIDPFRGLLRVCKAFVDNGDEIEIGPTQFTFEWSDRFRTFEFPIGPFIPEGVTGCSGFSMIDVYPGDTVTIRELPTEGFAMAPGFPMVELDGPNGFAARSGTSVTVDLTRCPEEADFSANLIAGEDTFECRVTFSNRALAEGEEPPCEGCNIPDEPDPVVVEPEPTPEPPVFVETPVVVEPQPTAEPSPEATVEPSPEPTAETPDTKPVEESPTPVETVAGETMPGPQPTPLAPSTGSGVVESTGGRLAVTVGLAVLSLAFFLGGLGLSRRE